MTKANCIIKFTQTLLDTRGLKVRACCSKGIALLKFKKKNEKNKNKKFSHRKLNRKLRLACMKA